MKLISLPVKKNSEAAYDKKSDTSSSSKNMDEDTKRNHRLNQNRISAMKCRQKKKQQFQDLVEKRDVLDKNNLELQEKLDNIKKQFKETQEENEDLKKRLNFMERQQEILFRIVSEAKGNNQPNYYSMPLIPQMPSIPIGQMDALLKMTVDQKLVSPTSSAFAPSKPVPIGNHKLGGQITPSVNQSQSATINHESNGQTDNGISLAQILSEIYSSNIVK